MRSFSRSLSWASLIVLTASVTGCSFLIPEDTSAPRYNIVQGERRMPKLNTTAPAAPTAMNDNFYVAPRMQSDAQMAYAQPVAAPPSVAQAGNATTEPLRMPVENNGGAMAVAQTSYPDLTTIPPRPSMIDDNRPAVRLNDVRTDLENERDQANYRRDELARDAAAEPPITLPASNAAPVTTPYAVPPMPVIVPPPAAYAPAPQSSTMPAPTIHVSSVPPVNASVRLPQAASQTIKLRPPSSMQGAARIVPQFQAPQPMPAPVAGGFNPLTNTPTTSSVFAISTPSDSYLPPSRYASRR
jgi:hypothetical protein